MVAFIVLLYCWLVHNYLKLCFLTGILTNKKLVIFKTIRLSKAIKLCIDIIVFSEYLENDTFFERYFHVTIHSLDTFSHNYPVLNNSYFIFFCYVISKIATFATDYGDVLCIVLSYKITSKIQSLTDRLENSLQHEILCYSCNSKQFAEITTIKPSCNSNFSWQLVYQEIIEIRKLTDETSKFLSPVLLISLTLDIFTILYNVSCLE